MRFLGNFLRKRISFSLVLYLILIYLIIYFVLLGVELVVRGTSAEVLSLLITLGVILGWLLGRSKLKLWAASLIASISGIVLTIIHVGGIDSSIWDLIKSAVVYLFRLVIQRGVADPSAILFRLSVIQTRTLEILSSLPILLNDILTGFRIYNQISTLLTWGFIIFLLAAWLAWITRNKDLPLWGVIPPGVLLSILMTYTLERRVLLVFLLGAGLILIGLINHDVKQREWIRRGILGATSVKERVALVVMGFSLYTMVFAGLMPSIRVRAIADPFERLIYGESENGAIGSEDGVSVGGFNSELYSIERFAGLPRQKLIGSGPDLTKRVVMIVAYPTSVFVESDLPNAARYWRSYVYDDYTGIGWQASPTTEIQYQPGQEIIAIESDDFEIVTQEIRLSNAIRGTIYSAGPPVTVDQEVLVSWRWVEEELENGSIQTVMVNDIFAVTIDTLVYQVRSLVPSASDDDLRSAGGEIPQWIQERYLALPETVTDRVVLLAQEVVSNQPTQYDKAKAIETFLRSYPYSLELPAPPIDRDIADYFLFDLQMGYCDYYATSMVVLARAVGLPARMVVGYVGGQYESETNRYLVTEADAHSWVEVYFHGFGWIPFEPTAARSLIDDETLELPLPPELETLPQAQESEQQSPFPWNEVMSGIAVFLMLSIWAWNKVDLSRLKRLDANSLVLVVYQRLYRYCRWLGLGHHRSDTIIEFDRQLRELFKELADSPIRGTVFTDGIYEIEQLTRFAMLANYGDTPIEDKHTTKILTTWKKLRKRLRRAVWIRFWKSMNEKVLTFRREPDNLDVILEDGASDG
jgi:transglutaminase-like putative cysteine protease